MPGGISRATGPRKHPFRLPQHRDAAVQLRPTIDRRPKAGGDLLLQADALCEVADRLLADGVGVFLEAVWRLKDHGGRTIGERGGQLTVDRNHARTGLA